MKNFVGIDVCEDKLDIFLYPAGEYAQFNNTSSGIRALCNFLGKYDIGQIGMEATGKLEALCAVSLLHCGYHVSIINPAQICYFRRSLGKKAKTDVIDAEVIARFTETMKPALLREKSETLNTLAELSARRRQLLSQKLAEVGRLRRVRDEICKNDIMEHISFLQERMRLIEASMLEMICNDADLCRKMELITSVSGIGKILALSLISNFSEIGTLNHKQAAALAGVVPHNLESGKGKTHLGMRYSGRKIVRSDLYMAVLVGIRHNHFIKRHYMRLLELGKPKKTAIGACMRKLVIILNSLVKENRYWND